MVNEEIETNLNQANEAIIHSLDEEKGDVNSKKTLIITSLTYLGVFLLFFALGLTIYWYRLGMVKNQSSSTNQTSHQQETKFHKGEVFGVDSPLFKDSAEGLLKKNTDPSKPGTHLLIRGDESQTVYLTSSILDLDKYVGHKVKIWGETQAVQSVGWFMDIGKLEILD